MLRYLPFVLVLALTVYCLVDAIQTDEAIVRGLPKVGWLLLVLVLPVLGPVAWLVAGRPSTQARAEYRATQQRWGTEGRRRPRPGPTRKPPQGPDDDPDFLKGI